MFKKTGIIFGVIIVLAASTVGVMYYMNQGKDEIHLIPEGYQGVVYIVFDQVKGKDETFEGSLFNKKRVYSIPENGVLVTKSKLDEGWKHIKYFYIQKDGTKSEINVESVLVTNTKNSKTSDDGYTYVSYLVGSEENLESFHEQRQKQSIVELLNGN